VPSEGGQGRGSHRKFAAIQVSFAAILERLQRFGLNIGALRSFSTLFQRGVALCSGVDLDPFGLRAGAALAEKLAAFRRGECVEVSNPAYRAGRDERVRLPAKSEDEVMSDALVYSIDDPKENVIAFASTLNGDDRQAVELYEVVHTEALDLDIGDVAWLLWQDADGGWNVAEQTDPGTGFYESPSVETGIYLAVGKIVRRVWGREPRHKNQIERAR
jgi:hypothetical protein